MTTDNNDYLLLETHMHTCEFSPCAEMTGRQTLEYYARSRYGAVAITNHYSEYSVAVHGKGEEQFVRDYVKFIDDMKIVGRELGLRVFSGCEVTLSRYGWLDMLIVGDIRQFLADNTGLYRFGMRELYARCSDSGLFLYQAHPFRGGNTLGDNRYMHGMESYNAHQDIRANLAAQKFCLVNGLKEMAGTDFHDATDQFAGITIPASVETDAELAKYLFTDKPQIAVLSGSSFWKQ